MLKFREGMYLLAKQHVAAGAKELIPGIRGHALKMQPNGSSCSRGAARSARVHRHPLAPLRRRVMGRSRALGHRRPRPVHGYEGLVVA